KHTAGPPEFFSADLRLMNTPDPSLPESHSVNETSAPHPVIPSQSTKPLVHWLQTQGREWALSIGRFAFDVARYYWRMRQPLWEYLAGFLPDLASDSVRLRTVRLSPDESHRMAEFGPDGWKILIPGRCVVCGEKTQIPA